MKKLVIILSMLTATAALAQDKAKLAPGVYAVFDTSMGTFTCELYQQQAPVTVENFIGLAEGTKRYTDPRTGKVTSGKPYYDGSLFHRVIDTFMIQSGDPTGTGMGGPGYFFQNETSPQLKHDREGRLSMANSGPNRNGSQFFVTLAPRSSLDGGYTIFGQVVSGMDVVKKIGKVPTKVPEGGRKKSRPVTDVILKKVTIQRVRS
jgi:peptidyl-prolyl cis-trans isomerase A (cyclophilin A)